MHVIALHGVRGGTSRTTLALALVSALAAQQRQVLLLDATRWGHIPDWGRLFAKGGQDRLSRRIRLMRAREGDDVARAIPLARAAGIEVVVIDSFGRPARRENPLTCAALEAADLVLMPLHCAHDARMALEEAEALHVLPVAAVACYPSPYSVGPPALRAAWEAAGGAPEAFLHAALSPREAFAEIGPSPWVHARHANLLAREGGRRPDLSDAGPDVTAAFGAQAFDPVSLHDHAGAVREANALAAEVLFRLEGFALAPLEPPEDEARARLLARAFAEAGPLARARATL